MSKTDQEHGIQTRSFSPKYRFVAIAAAVLLVLASSTFVFLDLGGSEASQVSETGQASLVAGSNQGAPSDGATGTVLNQATTAATTTQAPSAKTEPETEAATSAPTTKATTTAPRRDDGKASRDSHTRRRPPNQLWRQPL